MYATAVLQKVLGPTLQQLHRYQCRSLLLAVESLISGRRLTLMDLARSYPGAERVRGPLKRLDRLLGNERVQARREQVYAGMARWLLGALREPILLVDWSDLKGDGCWCLLRASVALRGRSVPLLDQVVSRAHQGNGQIQRQFLRRLRAVVPRGVRPVVVTDAGFRADWFMAVERLGWCWIGRVRGRTRVRQCGERHWEHCAQLHARLAASPRRLGLFDIVKARPCRCLLQLGGRRRRRGRRSLTRAGTPSADRRHLKAAQREREACLLACCVALEGWSAARVVSAYGRRMQIEESFRDLKSHRYGQGFEDSLSRRPERLQMLLLIHALAVLAAVLIGHVGVALGLDQRCRAHRSCGGGYSLLRLGWELAAHGWISLSLLMAAPLRPPPHPDAPLAELAL